MEVHYCERCHLKKRVAKYDDYADRIEAIGDEIEVVESCNSACGPGEKNYCAFVDGEFLLEPSFEELLEGIEEEYED